MSGKRGPLEPQDTAFIRSHLECRAAREVSGPDIVTVLVTWAHCIVIVRKEIGDDERQGRNVRELRSEVFGGRRVESPEALLGVRVKQVTDGVDVAKVLAEQGAIHCVLPCKVCTKLEQHVIATHASSAVEDDVSLDLVNVSIRSVDVAAKVDTGNTIAAASCECNRSTIEPIKRPLVRLLN